MKAFFRFELTHNSGKLLLFVRNRTPLRHLEVFLVILTFRMFFASKEAFLLDSISPPNFPSHDDDREANTKC